MNRLSRSTLWRLFAYFKPKRFQYVLSMLVVAGLFASERLFTGWIVLLFTDAIANQDMLLLRNAVLYWALFSLGLMLVSPMFLYLWRSSIVQGVASLRQAVFSHLQRLPLAYFESRHTGEAMSFLTNDVTASEQAFTRDILDLVQSTLQAVGAVIFMLFLKWDLAVIIIIGGMVPLVVNVISARRLRLIGQETQGRLAGLSERLSDLLAGFQVIRTFNLGDWILERFTRSNQDVFAVSMRRVRIESALASANDIGAIAVLLSYTVGAYMVLDGQTSLGVLFGLIQLNNPVQTFFYRAGEIVSRIQASLAAGDRLLAVLAEAPEPERYFQPLSLPAPASSSAGALPPASPVQVSLQPRQDASQRKVIELLDVRFAYGDDAPILSGLCLEVQQGQMVALVGPSGSGKSTIFRLLMGHFPVKDGCLEVFGQPAYALSLQELRLLFAYVPQDAYLFSGSVLENIRYGRLDADEQAVIDAATASYAHEFIQELPQGYHTQVGERGARLSGGQRQRIAIARALIKDAPVLLLDEATSALDSESEELVQKALERLMQGRTTIAIAHRLSTIEHADLIYVLENGKVVEQGRHAGLLEQGGLYSRLYNLQFNDETKQALSD